MIRIREDKFQQYCVADLKNNYPRFDCASIKNESQKKDGHNFTSYWKSMGLKEGHSDLVVFDKLKNDRTIYYVEFKAYYILSKGNFSMAGEQSKHQKKFQAMIESMGFEYHLIWNPILWKEFLKKII